MNYQQALDCIFESFIAAKPLVAGKLDRDVRNPLLLLDIAKQHNLLPPREKVIKVTGSKGKGTVVRLIANSLQEMQKNVALIISPEEITHLDRIRLNGQAISQDAFVECFETVWDLTHNVRQNLTPPSYLSPYGLFLMIALVWFKSKKIDAFVIETGRGVRFDEGGLIPAKVGVVTSIFNEHPTYLGPSLAEITADKLSICESVDIVIHGEKSPPRLDRPAWFAHGQHTALRALEAFLERTVKLPDADCASFGNKQDETGRIWFYEGMIAPESADMSFLKRLVDIYHDQILFLISLPDDKDVDGVCALLDTLNAPVKHIIMTGERGFLKYDKAHLKDVIYEGAYDDPDRLRSCLDIGDAQTIYFIGTQTYLRLVKQAFFI